MQISCNTSYDSVHISLIGQLWQQEDVSELERVCSRFVDENKTVIVLNVDRLSFISSLGLGILVKLHAQLQHAGGKLILFNPRSSVLEVVELSGFDMFMAIAHNETELLQMLH